MLEYAASPARPYARRRWLRDTNRAPACRQEEGAMPRPHHSNPPSCVHSRSSAMPIFTYFAVVGSVMIALLFVAGATLEKGSPAVVTSQSGLPKPWHPVGTSDRYNLPRPWRPDPIQILSTAPAPAPDRTSPLVLAAQPKVHAAPEVLAKVEPAARAARAEAPPRKKRVIRKQPPHDYRQDQAWSRDRNHAPFGGDRFSAASERAYMYRSHVW
jgi:hypothetical protein